MPNPIYGITRVYLYYGRLYDFFFKPDQVNVNLQITHCVSSHQKQAQLPRLNTHGNLRQRPVFCSKPEVHVGGHWCSIDKFNNGQRYELKFYRYIYYLIQQTFRQIISYGVHRSMNTYLMRKDLRYSTIDC